MRVAYDAEGKPTKALEGFVRTNACALDDVFRVETDKGEYVAVPQRTGGELWADPLAETALRSLRRFRSRSACAGVLTHRHMPARCADPGLTRRCRDSLTVGPMGPLVAKPAGTVSTVLAPLLCPMPTTFLPGLCNITIDPAQRRSVIIDGGNAQAAAAGGKAEGQLVDEVQGLVEHPVAPLPGRLTPPILEVPHVRCCSPAREPP